MSPLPRPAGPQKSGWQVGRVAVVMESRSGGFEGVQGTPDKAWLLTADALINGVGPKQWISPKTMGSSPNNGS